MLLSLGQAKDSSILNIVGVSPNNKNFIRLINEATRRLMERGDFEGLLQPIYVCVNNGCIVWPRYVGQVRQLNYCRGHIEVKNVWWDFLPFERGCSWNSNSWWGWMEGGWKYGRSSMVNQSRSPVFQDIQGDGRTIRAYNDSPQDNNKSVWIFGEDNNGQRLMTTGAGPWKDGIQLSLKAPFVSTPINIRRIDRVIKDMTTGPVRLYAFNSSANVLEDVAYYEPSETNPDYLRSRLSLPSLSTCTQAVIALVKLQFVPVFADTDPVLIGNITALKHMIQCIRCEEAQEVENARQFLVMAIDELNQELANANPETQIPVELNPLGHNQYGVGSQRMF